MGQVVMIGAGGHAKVVIDILSQTGIMVYGITDRDPAKWNKEFCGAQVLGNDDILSSLLESGIYEAFIGVGSIGDNTLRSSLYTKIEKMGFTFVKAVHPSAVISQDAVIGNGTAVMAGVIINPDARVGNNVVLNTGCIIEHDVDIKDHVFIAPGAIIAGGVRIGEKAFIGMGAKVIQGIQVGENALIGAGSVVTKDVPPNAVVMGVPGRITRMRSY